MMKEIWEVSNKNNRENLICGHLAFAKSLHVAQLLEGPRDAVFTLMETIRKDRRVVIDKEFCNNGWKISQCYSFQSTQPDLDLLQDPKLTLEQLFNMIPNTCKIRRCGMNLPEFYEKSVDIFLLKYIVTD